LTVATRPRLHSSAFTASGSNGVMPKEIWSMRACRVAGLPLTVFARIDQHVTALGHLLILVDIHFFDAGFGVIHQL